ASLGRIGPMPAHVDRPRRRHSIGDNDGAQCDTVKDGPVVGLLDPRPHRPHDRGGFHSHSAAPAHCNMGLTGGDASMSNCDVPGSDRDASMSGGDVTSSDDASMPNRDVKSSDDASMPNCDVTGHPDISTECELAAPNHSITSSARAEHSRRNFEGLATKLYHDARSLISPDHRTAGPTY